MDNLDSSILDKISEYGLLSLMDSYWQCDLDLRRYVNRFDWVSVHNHIEGSLILPAGVIGINCAFNDMITIILPEGLKYLGFS